MTRRGLLKAIAIAVVLVALGTLAVVMYGCAPQATITPASTSVKRKTIIEVEVPNADSNTKTQ